MRYRGLILCMIVSAAAYGQAAAPAKPAAAKPAPRAVAAKPAAAAGSSIDTIVELVKGGLSETMILQVLKKEGKAYNLAPLDLLKLQKAGVSENIVKVMMDPKAEVAAVAPPPPAPAPAPVAAPVAVAEIVPASAPVPPVVQKRKLAVTAFDYSAVKTAVTFWFKNDVNIGEGIRAMLTVRLGKAGKIGLVERTKVNALLGEQDFGGSNRVNQGTKARIGRITGADAILLGDIVIFGRDDVVKKTGFAGALRNSMIGSWSKLNKEEKAVVAINFRIVDAETGEVIETGEARGESSRKSKDWGAVLGTTNAAGGAGASMQSSNFEETIIGEATMNAVDKLADELNRRIPALPKKALEIEGRVAQAMPDGTLYINVGAADGVQAGDRFEIHQIMDVVLDPVTKEVLDQRTVKVGDMQVKTVREKVTIGSYNGPAINLTVGKGFAARKVL
jgi:curli biogenesis system outer membrane secretion channel CsgG